MDAAKLFRVFNRVYLVLLLKFQPQTHIVYVLSLQGVSTSFQERAQEQLSKNLGPQRSDILNFSFSTCREFHKNDLQLLFALSRFPKRVLVSTQTLLSIHFLRNVRQEWEL